MRVVCIKKYVYVYKEPLLLYADYFVCVRERRRPGYAVCCNVHLPARQACAERDKKSSRNIDARDYYVRAYGAIVANHLKTRFQHQTIRSFVVSVKWFLCKF